MEVTVNAAKEPRKGFFIARWSAIIGLVAVTAIVLNVLAFGTYKTVLDGFFRPSVTRSQALTETSDALVERIQAEGMVLLKNDNNTLPLAGDSRKVNVFGWSSVNPVYGGAGSGAVHLNAAVDLLAGLESAGLEYNTELANFYRDFHQDRPRVNLTSQDWTVPEPTQDEYDAAGVFEKSKEFSDTAIMVISRAGGEGADLPDSLQEGEFRQLQWPDGRVITVGSTGSENADDLDPSKHYLELSNREIATLQRVTAEFGKVIVLLNLSNVFELGWIDQMPVDSVVWIGGPGETGFRSVGKLLTGEVNPSGRTVDTWTYDLLSHPTQGNFGAFNYSNTSDADTPRPDTATFDEMVDASGINFVNYAEGIYVGYRYYETYYLGDEAGYARAVQFPFGYGLSYTTFTQQLGKVVMDADTVSVDVTVTNTGSVAGKEVAELYVTAPYTEGGIEKAHVSLFAFGKTDELAPGASQVLTLSAPVSDLASFDEKGKGAYVLEAGDYEFKLMRNSHDLIASETVSISEPTVYDAANPRPTDQVAATTQFADAAGQLTVLSRAGGFANRDEALAPRARVCTST